MEEYFITLIDEVKTGFDKIDTRLERISKLLDKTEQKSKQLYKELSTIETKLKTSNESYSLDEVEPLVKKIKQKDLNEAQTVFLDSVFGYAVKWGKVSAKQYESLNKML